MHALLSLIGFTSSTLLLLLVVLLLFLGCVSWKRRRFERERGQRTAELLADSSPGVERHDG